MEEKKMKEVIEQDVIMQSVLGKLYDILTMGEDDTPKGNQDFFSWATPGIPVSERDFAYMTEGFEGRLRTEDLTAELKDLIEAGDIKEANEINKQEIIDRLVKNDMTRKGISAYNFFHLVNFIPDTSGVSDDGITTYRTHEQYGSLSDLYYYILLNCSVRRTELDEKTQERIESYRKLLYKTVEKPAEYTEKESEAAPETSTAQPKENKEEKKEDNVDDLFASVLESITNETKETDSSDKKEESTDSKTMDNYQDWVLTYFEKETAYRNAVAKYSAARAKAIAGSDREFYLEYQGGLGENLKNQVLSAKRDWEGAGRKATYEKLIDSIALIEKGDMITLVKSYIDTMETQKLTEPNSRDSFYYTTLSPASFATSEGWTRFSFDFDHTKTTNNTDYKKFSSILNTNSSSFFHKHHTTDGKTDNHSTMDFSKVNKRISISFDMCQVNIVRPWFHHELLSSRNWRFKQSGSINAEELLSDGKIPPTGLLTAYPTSVIFIRNLSLYFHDAQDFANFKDDFNQRTRDYGGSVSVGFFNIKADANYISNSSDTKHDETIESTFSGQTITVKGMQIIGYKCHLLGLSPNPDPSITTWLDRDE